MKKELLDQLCHEAGNHGFITHGIIKKLVKLQEFPVKNRQEIETLHTELLERERAFADFTKEFRCKAVENGN